MKAIRRWLRALRRYPRLVSYADYMKLRVQMPQEQRKRAKLSGELNRMRIAHTRERRFHRDKVTDCESLKRLVPAERLSAWKLDAARERSAER